MSKLTKVSKMSKMSKTTEMSKISKMSNTVGTALWDHLFNRIKLNQIYKSQITLLYLLYESSWLT
jgi:hypothetical protein